MSKYVKELITVDLKQRLAGISDLLLVDLIGLDNNKNVTLRRQLSDKNINLVVVKNSLARRATEGTVLAPAFERLSGSSAIVWGAEDIVSLAKHVTAIADTKEFEPFAPKGGVMDGQALSQDEVKAVSKWPNREELISIVAGQLIGAGSEIASQLTAPATQIASQIEKLIEIKEAEEA